MHKSLSIDSTPTLSYIKNLRHESSVIQLRESPKKEWWKVWIVQTPLSANKI